MEPRGTRRGNAQPKFVGLQVISESTTYPVDVLVLMKLRLCPGEQPKYSGKFADRKVAELFAVTSTLVLSIVAQMPPARL